MTGEERRLVEQLWERLRPLAEERVVTIGHYAALRGRGSDDETARQAAMDAAHALSGSLGSYGRPEGSALAEEVEALVGLPGADPERLQDLAERLADVVSR